MKRPPLTVNQVLRELRVQARTYRAQIKQPVAPLDAVTRAQLEHGLEALSFAIRFIREHQITPDTLQSTIDKVETISKSWKKHGGTT